MEQGKRIGKCLLLFFLCLSILVLTVNAFFKRTQYNPGRNIVSSSTAFSAMCQLTMPSVTQGQLDQAVPKRFFFFQPYRIRFWLNRCSAVQEDSESAGALEFQFGKARLVDFDDRLQVGSLTVCQNVFWEDIDDAADWKSVQSGDYYEVWFRFKEAMDTVSLFKAYPQLLETHAQDGEEGPGAAKWIPVKTSADPADTCIGMEGRYSWHYTLMDLNVSEYQKDPSRSPDKTENDFYSYLKYLRDHSEETMVYLQCGLWDDTVKLDFAHRLDYVQQNGINCLGMVVYLRGDALLAMQDDSNLQIVRLYQEQQE